MPHFSDRSNERLSSAHSDLQNLFDEVIKHYDCTVLEGHRGEQAQNEAVRTGHSQVSWADSMHNKQPSMAVDVAPYPIDWNDYNRFYAFGGFVMGIASQMGIKIRWGGDWDGDNQYRDQSFNDLPHFELIPLDLDRLTA